MGAVRREGGKGVDAPGREVIRRDCAVEEQRRPGAPGGGATGRRVLEKRYRGIVAAYVVYGERKVANCKCMCLLKQMIAMGRRRRGRGGCIPLPTRLTVPGCLDPQDDDAPTRGTR